MASVTADVSRSVSSSTICSSSLCAGWIEFSFSTAVTAALIEVRGVLHSCANASSRVDFNFALACSFGAAGGFLSARPVHG